MALRDLIDQLQHSVAPVGQRRGAVRNGSGSAGMWFGERGKRMAARRCGRTRRFAASAEGVSARRRRLYRPAVNRRRVSLAGGVTSPQRRAVVRLLSGMWGFRAAH
ncbi:hypothetical protein IE994_23240 [Enterobacter hormaechei]|nr:hypothetical protein [Enterobacter hormaechei]